MQNEKPLGGTASTPVQQAIRVLSLNVPKPQPMPQMGMPGQMGMGAPPMGAAPMGGMPSQAPMGGGMPAQGGMPSGGQDIAEILRRLFAMMSQGGQQPQSGPPMGGSQPPLSPTL